MIIHTSADNRSATAMTATTSMTRRIVNLNREVRIAGPRWVGRRFDVGLESMADLRSGLGYLSFERIQPGLQRFDLGLARLQQFLELLEPPALLGTICARLSRFEEAAAALSDAIGHQPPRNELLDLLKRLGQCYRGQGKVKEAIATWSGIEDRFPGDRRVLVELAELFGDEGQIDEAIGRWEQVVSLAGQDQHQQFLGNDKRRAWERVREDYPSIEG
jgi:tetratricopeptide (TPR) repeat protein